LLASSGTLICLCAACLLLVIAGGVLIIYDPLEAGPPHRLKLVGVFASLSLLILVLPAAAPRWPLAGAAFATRADRASQPVTRTAVSTAGDGSVRSRQRLGTPPIPWPGPVGRLLAQCQRGTRVCLIGDSPAFVSARAEWLRSRGLGVDHWPYVGSGADAPLARLRVARRQYDLVILGPAGLGVRTNRDLWTLETFARLTGLVGPGGLVVVRIPPAGLEPEDIRTVARTFLEAFGRRASWLVLGGSSLEQAELWLLGGAAAERPDFGLAWRAPGADVLRPISSLLRGSGSEGIHSAAHQRLRTGSASDEMKLSAQTAALLSLPKP
jgi:hypothetical protein